jgi:serine/threonine protein kinase
VTTETDLDKVAHALPAYDIGNELGRGAMGVVISGQHRQLGRPVAIKQLPLGFGQDPTVKVRFVQEARLLASLDHPHIVPVFDFVDQDGLCLLVMEMLTGGTVWSKFTTTGLTNAESCGIVMATAGALQAAHARGILHRDIKPENLMFSGSGALKVTDFGIAAVVGGDQTLANENGEVIGTPAYMAPEQALGQALSPATDVFAAGVLLYELLTGQLPYPSDGGPVEVLQRHAYDEPIAIGDVAPAMPPQQTKRSGIWSQGREADRARRDQIVFMAVVTAACAHGVNIDLGRPIFHNRVGLTLVPLPHTDLPVSHHRWALLMDALTLFGLVAVTAMLIFYALEDRSPWFILAFAGACVLASAYGFLQGAWPFGIIEAIWAGVAARRWRTRRHTATAV